MTKRSLGFLAAVAAFAAFGGLHLEIAAGRALDRLPPDDARLQTGTALAANAVDRSAKTDRGEITLSSTGRPHHHLPAPRPAIDHRGAATVGDGGRCGKRPSDIEGAEGAR